MAKLYYKWGVMSSNKSLQLLTVAHNYETQGKPVKVFTPSIDDRSGKGVVASRVGLQREAIAVEPHDDLYEIIEDHFEYSDESPIYCLLVDEAQFLTKQQVAQLARIVDDYDTPVMAFGLKTDFQNNLFEGSAALLTYADKIEEMKTICTVCNRRAILNLRINNGKPVYEGEQVQIGGDESYLPVCRYHYFNYKNPDIEASSSDLYMEVVE